MFDVERVPKNNCNFHHNLETVTIKFERILVNELVKHIKHDFAEIDFTLKFSGNKFKMTVTRSLCSCHVNTSIEYIKKKIIHYNNLLFFTKKE